MAELDTECGKMKQLHGFSAPPAAKGFASSLCNRSQRMQFVSVGISRER